MAVHLASRGWRCLGQGAHHGDSGPQWFLSSRIPFTSILTDAQGPLHEPPAMTDLAGGRTQTARGLFTAFT